LFAAAPAGVADHSGDALLWRVAESFNLKEPVGTNLAYYLPDASPWLKSLLSFGDVIGIWVLVLLVIGGAIVAKKSIGQAAAVVVGWWLLIVLVSVAATAAFS